MTIDLELHTFSKETVDCRRHRRDLLLTNAILTNRLNARAIKYDYDDMVGVGLGGNRRASPTERQYERENPMPPGKWEFGPPHRT